MNKENFFIDYCSGCGLCKNIVGVEYRQDEGFKWPARLNEQQIEFCEKICPVNGINYNKRDESNLWGPAQGIYKGWACDMKVRYAAASGGVLSALCNYLLASGECDGIIQIRSDENNPLSVELQVSENQDQVMACAASRYITCMTFENLLDFIMFDKRYAVVGKPCDVEALTNYMNMDEKMAACIKYRLTFFCAGAPSITANMKLVETLGASINQVQDIRYRGNGWPGKASVCLADGTTKEMEYIDSWNKILGRDIRKICKFCVNGIGLFADISCGDLWKLNDDKTPSFEECAGQNIVFARTQTGKELLIRAQESNFLHLENYMDLDELKYIQPNHYNMQTTMSGKLMGLRLCENAKFTPQYNIEKLLKLSKNISKLKIIRAAIGTIKRIIKGRI